MLALQVKKLPVPKLLQLKTTLIEASIAFEAGGHPKEVFRRAKHRQIGLLRRIYEMLETADSNNLAEISKIMNESIFD